MLENIAGVLEASRAFLPLLLPLFFTASLFLAVMAFFAGFHKIRKQFIVKRTTWIMLVVIIMLGFYMRLLTPVFLVTFYDEFAHIDTGNNIFSFGRAEMCTGGYTDIGKESCTAFNEPAGFPYIVGVFLFFFGFSQASAYAVNIVMGSLLSLAVFLFCFLLFKSEKAGLYSAFVVSILPLYMLLSRNIEPDISSAFFILLTFIGSILFFRIKDTSTGVFAASILAFSVSIKQENILLLPLVFLLSLLYLNKENFKNSIKNYRYWLLLLLLIVLITPHLFHLSLELYPSLLYGKTTATAVGGKLLKADGIFASAPIFYELISGSFYPVLINLFLVMGMVYSFKSYRREAIFLVTFLSSFFLVYASYSGNMSTKYLVTVIIPLICFAGLGMHLAEKFALSRLRFLKSGRTNIAIPLIIALVLFLISVPYFYEVFENPKPLDMNHGFPRNSIQYKEVEVIEMMKGKTGSCYIVAERPVLFSATALKVIRSDIVLSDTELVSRIIENGSCILYFEDFYCTDFYRLGDRCGIKNESVANCENLRQTIKSRCDTIKEKFNLQPYLKYEFGEFEFAVYNITLNP